MTKDGTIGMNNTIAALNTKIIEECVDYLVLAANGNVATRDVVRMVANIVECSGGQLDACSSCGRMPMESICNNARCQDLI